jgi:putative tryptophan/tyrosine transport system substrate-binding protein
VTYPTTGVPIRFRRRFVLWLCLLSGLVLSLLLAPLPAVAVTEIVILKSSDIAAYNQAIAGFKAALPGTVTLIEYDLQGDLEKGRKLARKIRASDPALVLAVGLKAAKAAQLEIVDIPILYSMVLDPAKYGLSTPNMTGVLLEVPLDRQLAAIKTLLPHVKHIGTLYDPAKTASAIDEANRLLRHSNNADLNATPVSSEKEVPAALGKLLATVGALWLIPDSTVLTDESLRFILNSALEAHVPVIGFSREFAKTGALLCLSVNYQDIGRQAGQLARRILDGRVTLPLRPIHPDRVEMTLNMKTAKYLGIEIPRDMENRADELY